MTSMNNTRKLAPVSAEDRLTALASWLCGSDADAALVRTLHAEQAMERIAVNLMAITELAAVGEFELVERLRLANHRMVDEIDTSYRAVAAVSPRHRRVHGNIPSGRAFTTVPTVGSMLAWRCMNVVDLDLFESL